MKRVIKSLLPFVAIAALALWWISTMDRTPPEQAKGPPEQVAKTTEMPPAHPAPPESASWPTYHGDHALTGYTSTPLPEKLTRLWSYQAKGPVYATPVVAENMIFSCTSNGWVFALDRSGAEVWSKQFMRESKTDGKQVPERFEAPLSCFNALVLLGSAHGTVYALDTKTGEARWTYAVGGPVLGTVNGEPVASESESPRLVVIGQEDGVLHCIDAGSGQALWKTEGIDRCDGSPSIGQGIAVFGSCAAALHVFSMVDGAMLRSVELGEDSQVAGGVALDGDSVFSGSHSGRFFHASTKTGALVWVNEDSNDEVFTTPAVDANRIVFGALGGTIYCLDRETGKTAWKFEAQGEPTSPVIAGDKVLFAADGALHLLDLESGEELWTFAVSDTISAPALAGGLVLLGGDDGTVSAFGAAQS
ncbi:MAG: PQQ-binding-like beta-propeller repeat protein [Candidatus Hydrogenedentes bacterium]|nr:PQQ-binding-like beta-propeller repeat protein [Candidatus Hydrogenedentota bacterium]